MTINQRRIRLQGLREIGLINWVICRIAARAVGAKRMHLFTTLAPHKCLFWAWLPFSGILLGGGRLPRKDTELVILRVAYLRDCEYELQHHRRIAKKHGIDEHLQSSVFAYPEIKELSHRQEAIVRSADEFVQTRTISHDTWSWLAFHLDQKQLIELCVLIGQYDALAATISALHVPLDFSEE